eukprot:CAMPEP_0201519976 /NCGR_PEP_ID=MMETSP0161_2-20130828/10393_1 /ASSEMBLY_ACC=CAM_ASM_000251 /TAXON_ID=180227 /ORGANISM="Neoparamoeba aestuarina, Strain SoJaBio B1-5/56/2" /LENGTH=208 /DNA_ID=CAMNT_0047918185 /DNA_START=98 /DNA_END=721 /DNA_ORIENTATION=+
MDDLQVETPTTSNIPYQVMSNMSPVTTCDWIAAHFLENNGVTWRNSFGLKSCSYPTMEISRDLFDALMMKPETKKGKKQKKRKGKRSKKEDDESETIPLTLGLSLMGNREGLSERKSKQISEENCERNIEANNEGGHENFGSTRNEHAELTEMVSHLLGVIGEEGSALFGEIDVRWLEVGKLRSYVVLLDVLCCGVVMEREVKKKDKW